MAEAKRTILTEKEQVAEWLREVTTFLSWRDKAVSKSENDRFVDFYRSRFYKNRSDDPRAGVPLIFAYVDVKMSAMDLNFPDIEVEPRNFKYEDQVNMAEAALDYEMRELNWRREWRKAQLSAHLTDYGGWCKLGYSSEFALTPKIDKGEDGQRQGTDGEEVEFSEVVKSEHPWIKHMDGRDVAFGRPAPEITDAPWVAIRYTRLPKDISRDDKLNDEFRNAIARKISRRNRELRHSPVEFWEFWNKAPREVFVVSHEIKDHFAVKPKPWPFNAEGFPITHLKFFDDPTRDVFGMASVRSGFALNEEANHLRSNALVTSKRMVPKYTAPPDVWEKNGREVFEGRAIGSVVYKKRTAKIELLDMPTAGADNRLLDSQVRDDYRFVTGVAEQQAGVGDVGGTTATEVNSRERFSNTRTGSMQGDYDDFISNTLRKALLIMKQFYPPSRLVPIYDPGSRRVVDWRKFTDDWKKAEYEFVRIVTGSTAKPTRQARQARTMQLLQTVPTAFQQLIQTEAAAKQSGRTFNATQLLRKLMSAFDDEISRTEWERILPDVASGTDPEEENAILLAGGRVYVSPGDNDNEHLRSHTRQANLIQMEALEAMEEVEGDVEVDALDQEVMGNFFEHIEAHQSAKMEMMMQQQTMATQQAQAQQAQNMVAQQAGGMQTPPGGTNGMPPGGPSGMPEGAPPGPPPGPPGVQSVAGVPASPSPTELGGAASSQVQLGNRTGI